MHLSNIVIHAPRLPPEEQLWERIKTSEYIELTVGIKIEKLTLGGFEFLGVTPISMLDNDEYECVLDYFKEI